MKKHVLVTGGAGFLGSHLCDLLLSKGYVVTAVDNFVTGRKKNVDHLMGRDDFQLIEADVSQPWSEEKFSFLKAHGLHGVLHFACPASPLDFLTIPMEILKVDSLGTFHATELAEKYKARFVVASTSEIYGDPEVHPQNEDYWGNVNSIGPRACYDETKRFSEAVVSTLVRLGRLNGGMVRIFNTYGPRMRLDDGRIVPELCRQALENRPLTLHGDGKQTRSFCYVSDLIDGIVRYFESSVTEPVNIGNPVEFSIEGFVEVLEKSMGRTLEKTYTPGRPDDPKRRRPDITRAKKLLGWEPKMSLEKGLTQTIEAFKGDL